MRDYDFSSTFRILTVERPRRELQDLLSSNGYTFLMRLAHFNEELWLNRDFLGEVKNRLGGAEALRRAIINLIPERLRNIMRLRNFSYTEHKFQ